MQVASRDRADVDAEPVPRPVAAAEALGEVLATPADVPRLGILSFRERRGDGRGDSWSAKLSLGDDSVAVAKGGATTLFDDRKWAVERGW